MPKTLPCGRPLPKENPIKKNLKVHFRKCLERFVEENHLNQSKIRTLIVDRVLQQPSHFSATGLANELKDEKIGVATIYRNLKILLDAGLVRESLFDESGQALYELNDPHHHDHIICMDCQAIVEFHNETIENIQGKLLKDLSFAENRHSHVIYAQCEYKKKMKKA